MKKKLIRLTTVDLSLDKLIPADYVLCDTWFTNEPLVAKIRAQGPHVIGMLKHMHNTSYQYKDIPRSLRDFSFKAWLVHDLPQK